MNVELEKRKKFKQDFKKRCFYFSLDILQLAEKLRNPRINWSLIDQLIRSATSIGANIVEGGYAKSKKDFLNFFQIALKSAAETLYWLALLREINTNSKDEINKAINECVEIRKIITTIILNTKSNSKF